MKAAEIVSELKQTNKGAHVKVTWSRPCKTLKSFDGGVITKRTSAFVRAGIDFANLASVKNSIANGERGEVQSLPWGTWREFPFVIEHKGNEYVRLYPASFNNLRPSVEYSRDGFPVTLNEIAPFLQASELRDNDDKPIECFTVKADSVISVG